MSKRKHRQLVTIESGKPWLCTQPAIKEIIKKSEVESDFLAQAEEPVDLIETKGEIAVIHIVGSIFRYSNLFTAFGMGVSVEDIDAAIQLAKEDKDIQAIIFRIDSPGGQASGIDELAQSIRNIDKPTIAYADDLCASGAYWLAAAADKIIASRSSFVGSVGVMAVYFDDSKAYSKVGIDKYTFYSTDSPQKITDPSTEDGQKQIMDILNYTADIFISSVAEYRDTSPDYVKKNFGGGALVNAKEALNLGMLDGIGTYEQALSLAASSGIEGLPQKVKNNLTGLSKEAYSQNMETKEKKLLTVGQEEVNTKSMDKKQEAPIPRNEHSVLNTEIDNEHVRKCERNRILQIQSLASSASDREFLSSYIEDNSSPQEAAFNLVRKQTSQRQNILHLRAEDTRELEAVGVSGEPCNSKEEAQYQKVLGHIKNYGTSLKGDK